MDIDEAAIRDRAYLIWEREGRPHGRHLDHWLQAHWELLGEAAAQEEPSAAPAAPAAEMPVAKPSPRKRSAATKSTDKAAGPAKAAAPKATPKKSAGAAAAKKAPATGEAAESEAKPKRGGRRKKTEE